MAAKQRGVRPHENPIDPGRAKRRQLATAGHEATSAKKNRAKPPQLPPSAEAPASGHPPAKDFCPITHVRKTIAAGDYPMPGETQALPPDVRVEIHNFARDLGKHAIRVAPEDIERIKRLQGQKNKRTLNL